MVDLHSHLVPPAETSLFLAQSSLSAQDRFPLREEEASEGIPGPDSATEGSSGSEDEEKGKRHKETHHPHQREEPNTNSPDPIEWLRNALSDMVNMPSSATLLGIGLVMFGCCLNNLSLEYIIRYTLIYLLLIYSIIRYQIFFKKKRKIDFV